MDLKELLNLQGLNYWLLASGFGLNAVLTVMVFILLLQFLENQVGTVGGIQLMMMVGLFGVNFVTALLVGKMANDLRGPTYGIIGSLSSAVITLFVLIPTGGVFGLLAAVVALAGGFNGGVMTLPRHPRGQ